MDDITTSPDLPASADLRNRAASHPYQTVPRRGLLELPAPAVPRPRSASDQRTAPEHAQVADSPLLAHAAKILSGTEGSAVKSATPDHWRRAQPALGSLWKDLRDHKDASVAAHHQIAARRQSVQSDATSAEHRRLSLATTDDMGRRRSQVSRSGSEDPWVLESEYEEEEGMSPRVPA